MFIPRNRKNRFRLSIEGAGDGLGTGEGLGEGIGAGGLGEGEGEGEGTAEEIPPYLRDLSEDDVYDRLNRVNEFPNQLGAVESRMNGGVNALSERMTAYEKGLPTQSSFDVEALTKGLEAYDPKLAEVLGPLLQDAFKVSALDENSLRPHLDPMQEQMRNYVGEQLVRSVYSPETIGEIIPQVVDGKFMPEGQRQKDFADWYGQQGYETQQSLLSFGAPYINSLRKFEAWETNRNGNKVAVATGTQERLAKGQVPAGQHRKPAQSKKLSDEDAFMAGFNEI